MVSEMARWGKVCICGPIKVVNLPKYYDFVELRRTPAEVREMLEEHGERQRGRLPDAQPAAPHP